MKFGVGLHNYGPQSGRLFLVDAALAAEAQGYESVWLTDHIALPQADAEQFGTIFEAITTLAYLAGCTRTVKLGISALVLPQRNPVEVAKQIATVDLLSGGRVILAAGVGWSEGEFRNLGYNFHDRGKRMDEAVKVLRTLWRGGTVFKFEGQFTQFENAVFLPGPVQAGGPPLWIGGNSPKAIRRAVMLADGWHASGLSPAEMDARLKPMRSLLANRPFTISVRVGLDFEASPESRTGLAGSPAQIIERLRAYQAVGVNHMVIVAKAERAAQHEAALRRFASEVLPALR